MYRKIRIMLILVFGAMILSGCFFGTPDGRMVTPEIRVFGLPDASAVDSVTLIVTGPDMDPVEVTYTILPSMIYLSVPEGVDRTFELTVELAAEYIASSSDVITSYKGAAAADITSDGVIVNLNMEAASTKIVVPDAYNHRLVQIDNMSGTGWSTATWTDLGFGNDYDFVPYDVDIDQYGNIYVANDVYSGSSGGIYKIDSIQFTTGTTLLPTYYAALDGNASVVSVAVDKRNNRVYGIAWGGVYYWDAPGDCTKLPVAGSPVGLAVDDEGNVYVCGDITTTATFPWIVKFSYSLSELATYTGGVAGTINDITILNGELYATKSGAGIQIEKFDPSNITVGPVGSFGTSGTGGTTAGEFYGPHNFVAILNKKLTIIDGTDYFARLVSFSDIDGTNWETYGSWDNAGNGVGVFKFFSNC